MLNSFRSFAGTIWIKILMLFLILAIGLWGVGDMIRRPSQNVAVATVGSQSITREQYARSLRSETENLRHSLGDNFSPEMVKSLQLPQRVLQRLVQHSLLQQESDALGLMPSDADVVRRLSANPAFQDSKGNFDKTLLQSMLRSSGMSEKTYVDNLRHDIAANLLLDTFSVTLPVPNSQSRALYEAREEKRTATLYTLSPALVREIKQPDAAQMEAYYKEHAHEFTSPEFRTLSYIVIQDKDVHNSVSASEDDLQRAYKERMEEFKRPERRAVDQLLFGSEEKAKKAYTGLKAGKSFEALAQDADLMNKNSTSLGKVERAAIMKEAGDEVFSLKAGEFTAPVKSPFGWHIFRVSAIEPPAVMSLEEAKPILEKDLKQHIGDEALSKLANKVDDMLAGGSTLAEVATQLDVKVNSIGPVNRLGKMADGNAAKDIPAYDKFMDTAFKTAEKSESPLVAAKGGVFYVVRVDSITPERLRTIDEVKGNVVAQWQEAERTKRLAALAKEIADKFSSATRAATIEEYHLKAASTGPITRTHAEKDALPAALKEAIFDRKPGESTSSFPTKNGEFIIAVVGDIIPAKLPATGTPEFETTVESIRNSLATTVESEVLEQYMHYLEHKFRVTLDENALDALLHE